MKLVIRIPHWWTWLRQWCRRLGILRVRPKQRPGVMTAKEVAKRVQLTPAEREKVTGALPDLGAPETLPPGARYEPKYGVTVYRDSESIVPYVGSEKEAEDAEKPRLPRVTKPMRTVGECCPGCFGWGENYGIECQSCGGSGSIGETK